MWEQLDCGWEPWEEASAKAELINLPGTTSLLKDPAELVQSCFWAAGQGQAGAETRCGRA